MILALCSGARHSAILQLTWDRVDFVEGTIDLRLAPPREPLKKLRQKGRALVPMNATLRAALATEASQKACNHVIHWYGRKVLSVRKGFDAACERAGLKDVTAHTLRHTFATWMSELGEPSKVVAAILGHSNEKITDAVYTHTRVKAGTREAVERLDSRATKLRIVK